MKITDNKNQKEYTKQVIEQIKQDMPITEYAQRLGFTLQKKGKYYTTKEHDSLMIDTVKQRFWRNAYGVSGDIVDFVQHFENIDKHAAIEKLKAAVGITHSYIPETNYQYRGQTVPEPQIKTKLLLPEKDSNTKNVFAYLTQTRKIDENIVCDLMLRDNLYQDKHKNCVFVSYNEKGEAVFANQRGTNTERKFIADVIGSDYNECFYLNHQSRKLIVTESVIDALSLATIFKEKQNNYKDYNYLALSGTNKIQSIFNHLEKHPEIHTVSLGLDNDEAGRMATEKIKEKLNEIGWQGNVIDYSPKIEKDWNAELQSQTYDYIVVPDSRTHDEIIKEIEYVCDDDLEI